jgi:hypothetical protein
MFAPKRRTQVPLIVRVWTGIRHSMAGAGMKPPPSSYGTSSMVRPLRPIRTGPRSTWPPSACNVRTGHRTAPLDRAPRREMNVLASGRFWRKADAYNWTKPLISRPRIPRRIFTAVPGPEKLEAQSKFRRDRQERVAVSQATEQEVPQARSTSSAHLARSRSLRRKKSTSRRPGFASSP